MKLLDKLRHARRAGVPIVAIETPDPWATEKTVYEALGSNGGGDEVAMIHWNTATGVRAMNKKGQAAVAEFVGESTGPMGADNLEGPPARILLPAIEKLPTPGVIVAHNLGFWLAGGAPAPTTTQAIANLRDEFARTRRMLVLVGSRADVPLELRHDVLALSEELPGAEQLGAIVSKLDAAVVESVREAIKEGKKGAPTIPRVPTGSHVCDLAVDAARGLPAFAAEQTVAMAMRQTAPGIDVDHAWEIKRRAIAATDGLSVWRGGESVDDIGGLDAVRGFCRRLLDGPNRPRVVVWVDEIEKMMAGASGSMADSSGVSQGVLQALLTHMQESDSTGMIFLGPPGAGKSMMAKTLGQTHHLQTIAWDSGAMKGGIVGQTEQAVRSALRVVDAVSDGSALWVATCNRMAGLPPELRRRFSLGTWFFDLPTADERSAIWGTYCDQYGQDGIIDGALCGGNDEGWTGAEIRACCRIAYELSLPLSDAARYIVPVAKAAASEIAELRQSAAGRYLSATHPGAYTMQLGTTPATRSMGD